MKRRPFLRGLAAASALATTGCLADDGPAGESPDDSPAPTDTPTPMPTDDPDDTPEPTDDTESPTPDDGTATPTGVTGQSLTVTASDCGAQTDDAAVAFDGETVTVTGTIWGNDACYTAVLADVTYDEPALTAVVAAEDDAATDEMCAQCITEIDYEAEITILGGLPDSVTVVHRHGDSETTVTDVTQ